jgi:hypothetical protein
MTAYNAANISDLFQLLESNNQEVVKEIKQVIYEQYEEGSKIESYSSKNRTFSYSSGVVKLTAHVHTYKDLRTYFSTKKNFRLY